MSHEDRVIPARMPEKYPGRDRAALHALIADARVGHVAFVLDGEPRVLPIAIVSTGDDILLHGSTGSRWLRLLATGTPVALSVTSLDAVVVARSAFESSMHYRSAVLFGGCRPVTDDAKVHALDHITNAIIPGRVGEIRRHSPKELAATLVLRLEVEDWSLKVSDGWPEDGPDDVAGTAWAGVLPVATGFTTALAAPDLAEGIPLPPSVQSLLEGRRSGYSPT
ncbi:pyridoxamine 5'-phosphate oxidase family protein [Lacisediminihabitans profunda]|nr:pyridoxamine 5'-phosphate oxidase family protein [Lacisediminihabitans profunda]